MPNSSTPNAEHKDANPPPPKAPAPPPPDDPRTLNVIDWESALARIPGGTRVARELAQILLDECPKQFGEIRTGIDNGDAVTAARGAHTLKGSADIFAAADVVAKARSMELLAREGNLQDVQAALPDLQDALERLMTALREWIDQQA